jgi:all-trans-retinol 13,14-reductase
VSLAESYKRTKPEGRWDAIVIGSGLGGLTTAALLAKQGKRCLVLERHYVIGGFTHVFKRKGFEWDVGVHYIGEVHKERSVLRQLFDGVTDGSLEWADMGEIYDRIVFGPPDAPRDQLDEYPLHKGVGGFKESLYDHFPDERAAIDEYVSTVFEVVKSSRTYFAEKALDGIKAAVAGPMMRRKYLGYARRTTLEVLRSMTRNEKLIGVLCGQYGDYGLPPAQSSFAMHATLVKHYFGGGAYPVGGSARIAEAIVPRITEAGGACFTNAEIEQVLVRGGKAVGVKMADGVELMADVVISNAGALNTFDRLLPESTRTSIGAGDLTRGFSPSASHVSLYIGLNKTPEELNLPKANYWIYPGYDHDANVAAFEADDSAPLPVTYISFPAAKDPDFQSRYPGKSTIEIITLAPWERFASWDGTRWKKRGDDYDAMKARVTERLLAQLFRFEPQTRDAIEYHELSTPLSTKHFVNYAQGEIYGLSHDPDRFASKVLRPKTAVDGLWLTGQDISTCGIGGALVAGYMTVSAMTKTNLIMDTLKAG